MRVHDEDREARTRDSFARQRMMDTLGVYIAELAPGRCVLEMPYDERFTQQHGYAQTARRPANVGQVQATIMLLAGSDGPSPS